MTQLKTQNPNSRLKLKTQNPNSRLKLKTQLKTQTHDSRTNIFYHHQSNQKIGTNKAWMVSHDMMLTCHMHEGIPLELNPVLKLLEMRKGCWWGICTTCLVSIWNEQKNRWDPFFNHDDDNNDHAQIHSRRIESCAQAAGNAQGPPGIREYAQLVWSLSLSLFCPVVVLNNGLRGRGHGITCPRGFFVSTGWWQQFCHSNSNNNHMLLTIECGPLSFALPCFCVSIITLQEIVLRSFFSSKRAYKN